MIKHSADVNAKDEVGYTSLHDAANNGHLEICELLIKHGADVNTKNEWGETTLHQAAEEGYIDICECLLMKYAAEMDIYWLSMYRNYDDSQLKHCFRYFEPKSNKELFDILMQKNATIRPFFLHLIQDEKPTLDPLIEEYACDLFFIYNRYRYIRFFLEHSLKFLNVRYSINKRFMKRYGLRFQFEYQHPIQATPLLIPTFTTRLTQNIQYCITK